MPLVTSKRPPPKPPLRGKINLQARAGSPDKLGESGQHVYLQADFPTKMWNGKLKDIVGSDKKFGHVPIYNIKDLTAGAPKYGKEFLTLARSMVMALLETQMTGKIMLKDNNAHLVITKIGLPPTKTKTDKLILYLHKISAVSSILYFYGSRLADFMSKNTPAGFDFPANMKARVYNRRSLRNSPSGRYEFGIVFLRKHQ